MLKTITDESIFEKGICVGQSYCFTNFLHCIGGKSARFLRSILKNFFHLLWMACKLIIPLASRTKRFEQTIKQILFHLYICYFSLCVQLLQFLYPLFFSEEIQISKYHIPLNMSLIGRVNPGWIRISAHHLFFNRSLIFKHTDNISQALTHLSLPVST